MSASEESASDLSGLTEAAPRRRGGWRRWLQIGFGVIAVALLIWTVVHNWSDFIDAIGSMRPGWVVAAAVLIFGGLYVNMLSWRSVVHALGNRLRLAPAARVFFVSQLAKYIPGGIWPIVTSARLGRAAGLPGGMSVVAMSIALLIGVTVGAVYSVGALYLVPAVRADYWWAPVILLVCGVVALLPPVLDRLIALALRIVRHEQMPPLRLAPFAMAILWSVISWGMLGGALACLVAALTPLGPGDILLAVSSYAFAWVCGFVAVIAPAGAGVREVVLGLTLGTFMPAGTVLGVVVVDRLLMTFGDVAMLLFAIRRRPKGIASEPETR